MRRGGSGGNEPKETGVYTFGAFRLDLASHVLVREGSEIPLTSGDRSFVRIFLEHPYQVLTAINSITLVKGYERAPSTAASTWVRVVAANRPNPESPIYLRTIWGVGYLFSPQGEVPGDGSKVETRASLFRRTALTVAAGLLVFQLASGAAVFFNLMQPLAQRSSDDLAALLVLSARTWVELPPPRARLSREELRASHGLRLI